MLNFFLQNFWFIGAGLALVNILIYRRAVQKRNLSQSDEAKVFRCFVLMSCLVAISGTAIGAFHLSAGHSVPLVPFASPLAELPGVRASWVLALGTVLSILVFINTRSERISVEIAEILVADRLHGRAALLAINVLAMGVVLLALGASLLSGWQA
ncbi:MAG: hypothetical protein GY946_10545 [bacterium]|nr:hypothetical protein [bacterium]